MRFLAVSTITPAGRARGLDQDMDAEIANGRRLFEKGFIVEGYMDPTYTRAYFLVDAADEQAALDELGTYPQVQAGLATYELTPLVGLPAVQQSLADAGEPLPGWWPR